MKLTIALILLLSSKVSFSQIYKLNTTKSKTTWHLFVADDEHVYGEIAITSGSLSLGKQTSGSIEFGLSGTKSYELEDGEKESNEMRDKRIRAITGAKKADPIFKLESVEKKADGMASIKGKLTLNEVTKDIEIKGRLKNDLQSMSFEGEYKLMWGDFEVTNPVMWFMQLTNKADPFITLKFKLEGSV